MVLLGGGGSSFSFSSFSSSSGGGAHTHTERSETTYDSQGRRVTKTIKSTNNEAAKASIEMEDRDGRKVRKSGVAKARELEL